MSDFVEFLIRKPSYWRSWHESPKFGTVSEVEFADRSDDPPSSCPAHHPTDQFAKRLRRRL